MQSYDDLNIMVGDSNIVSSNSARNHGVIFDKCIKLDYHIISVCKLDYFHLHCNNHTYIIFIYIVMTVIFIYIV